MKNFKFISVTSRSSHFGKVNIYNLKNKHYYMSIKSIGKNNDVEFMIKLINLKTKNCKKYYVNNIFNTLPKKYDYILGEIFLLNSFN